MGNSSCLVAVCRGYSGSTTTALNLSTHCGSPGKQMTMPTAAEFEQVGPKKQVEFRIYLVSKG